MRTVLSERLAARHSLLLRLFKDSLFGDYDDDSRFGHVVLLAVFFEVVSDLGVLRELMWRSMMARRMRE